MGHDVTSASLLLTSLWEEWLLSQRVMLLPRGTWTGWRNRLMEVQRPPPTERHLQHPYALGSQWVEKQLCREGLEGPRGHQVEQPGTCPCCKASSEHPGLHGEERCQHREGGDPFHLFGTEEAMQRSVLSTVSSSRLIWSYWKESNKGLLR